MVHGYEEPDGCPERRGEDDVGIVEEEQSVWKATLSDYYRKGKIQYMSSQLEDGRADFLLVAISKVASKVAEEAFV